MSHFGRNGISSSGKPITSTSPQEGIGGTRGDIVGGDDQNSLQVNMEREHVVLKRNRSPKNDPATQPEMVKVIVDIMEVEVYTIPT
jgi:hypothetical protein